MVRYITAFMVFSFLGWVWESIYCTICRKKWANRGFLYGPVCPIYGFGSAMALAIYDYVAKGTLPDLSVWQVLLLGIVASAFLEYPTSYLLEKLFHARWWDYSNVPLNINGRVSLPTAVGFGLAGILLFKVLLPQFSNTFGAIPDWVSDIFAFLSFGALSGDLTLTVSELTDFSQRVKRLDDSFQDDMTENVEKLIALNQSLKKRAEGRIVGFRYGKRISEIAKKLQEEKFDELIKDYREASKEKRKTVKEKR